MGLWAKFCLVFDEFLGHVSLKRMLWACGTSQSCPAHSVASWGGSSTSSVARSLEAILVLWYLRFLGGEKCRLGCTHCEAGAM